MSPPISLAFPFPLYPALAFETTREGGGGGLLDLTEKIDVDFPRFADSIKALAAFSLRPKAGGEVSLSFGFDTVF
jgi:hypothetical protein